MTSEICLMNRLAVVLAADSATTVTSWGDNGQEQRYFKGANKIFQLSAYHPVGMMIFDSADILKVPWEVVVKEFRTHLGDKSFSDLQGYATEFFGFLSENRRLFPDAVQKAVVLDAARGAALRIIFAHENPDVDAWRAAIEQAIGVRRDQLMQMPHAPCIQPEAPAAAVASWQDELATILLEWSGPCGVPGLTCTKELAEIGILTVFKEPESGLLNTTGIVFAGFGDHDVFPAMLEYKSCGIIVGSHVAREVSRMAIDHETPASLHPFAQRSMSDTFTTGISQDVYYSIMQAITSGMRSLAEQIATESGGDLANVTDIHAILNKARDEVEAAVLAKARREHAYPLRRVLGVLPVDEMSELAETLINLQSLKEKVTKPSETVGGPVDVAVITRGEGLVWIKRKHFFPPELNSRYMQRQKALFR